MSRFLGELTRISNLTCYKGASSPSFFRDYVLHGDRASLEPTRQAYPADNVPWLKGLWEQLGAPSERSEEERRAMQGAVLLDKTLDLTQWLRSWINSDSGTGDAYLSDYLAAFGNGRKALIHAAATIINKQRDGGWLQREDGRPNAAGRFLLSLSDARLAAAAKMAVYRYHSLKFLLRHAADRAAAFAPRFVSDSIRDRDMLSADCCRLLLDHDKEQFHATVLDAVRQAGRGRFWRITAAERRRKTTILSGRAGDPQFAIWDKEEMLIQKASVWTLLADAFPGQHDGDAVQANLALLRSRAYVTVELALNTCRWLARRLALASCRRSRATCHRIAGRWDFHRT